MIGVLEASEGRLDLPYLKASAIDLHVADLLARALAEAAAG